MLLFSLILMKLHQVVIVSGLLMEKNDFRVTFIVYRMGRLRGGAHEISGIKAPLFSPWWVVGGFLGWVGGWWWDGGWWGGWMVGWWWQWDGWWILVGWVGVVVVLWGVDGWVGDVMGSGWGGGVHLIGKVIFVLRKK